MPVHFIKRILLLLFLFPAVTGCREHKPTKLADNNGDPIYNADKDDAEMAKAIAKAKASISQFDMVYISHDIDLQGGSLKMRFVCPDGGYEYLWIDIFDVRKGIYYGTVGNTPAYTRLVKEHDTVAIPTDSICDWMYLKAGKMHGAYTVRVLRNNMTPEERTAFDRENHIDFAD